MLQIEEHPWARSKVAFVNQDGAATEQIAVSFESQVNRCIEQRMARANKGRWSLPWRCQFALLKGDPLIARQHRFAPANESIAIANGRRDASDFVAPRFPFARSAT